MRGSLVRRLLVLCAVAVTMVVVVAALRGNRVATVSAAGGSSNLELSAVPVLAGCPLGPAVTFCNQIPGTVSNEQPGFQITALNAVSGLAVSLAPIPGLSANLAASCATGGPCDFTILLNSCTGNLAAGAFCNITIVFTPTTSGLREAALTVTDTGGDQLAINVEGTGATLSMKPGLLICPGQVPDNAFQYCVEPVGGTSATEPFSLESANAITGLNIGFASVPGLASEFNADEPDFTIESTTCAGTLPAFTPCTVNVSFTPQTAGLREAALTATDSEGDSVTILLAGHTTTGLLMQQHGTPDGFPTCMASAGAVFCNEPTAGSTAPVAVTLRNTSGTQITGLTITPPVLNINAMPPPPPVNFTVESTSCTTALAVNASCVINVAFTPTTTGLLQGEILVTDDQGDVAGFNLAGTGDDFNMQIVNGQPTEVTVHQGGTATFMAQLNAVGVFGQNGEQVTLACPTNLPAFATCAFMPCPMKPSVGGTTAFSIVIVTSSTTVQAPEVPNPCNSPSAAFAPGPRGAPPMMRAIGERLEHLPPFPTVLAILTAAALGLGSTGAFPRSKRAVAGVALVIAMAGGGLMLGCGGGGGNTTKAFPTPIAVTTMNVVANAADSNGNPLNASRALQITLDVIK
jgi:hypothetical protein